MYSLLNNKFKSNGNERGTPQGFFDGLNDEFHFTLDPCASVCNYKCEKYYTKEVNGLQRDWGDEVVWVNPPYGGGLKLWVVKCYEEAQRGAVVVALIPARTNTNWWHDYCMRAYEIRFIRGRMRFTDEEGVSFKHGLPFPLALVVFKRGEFKTMLSSYDC